MSRKKTKGPKFADEIKKVMDQPIKVDVLQPLFAGHMDEFTAEYTRKLRDGRLAKLLLLATLLDIPTPKDTADPLQLMVFFRELALAIAVAYVPGFQAKPLPKWDRAILTYIVAAIASVRADGKKVTDFDACLGILQNLDPELKKLGNHKSAKKQARTLRNRVVQVRKTIERKNAGALN